MPSRTPLGEFEVIERFVSALPVRGEGVLLGPGDDAALLAPPRGEVLCATVDAVVEGVHFDARFSPEDVGWKALAVNLSDLASMGARPLWALVALAFPAATSARRLDGVARGLGACARSLGIAVAGGNVSRASELSITVTAVGSVPRARALTRGGARPGDVLLVSGTLGDAALGLAPGAAPALARRQRRPAPRVALGLALRGIASAAIDVSDGLVQDLGHLARASGVGAVVEAERLPRSRAGRAAAARLPDPLLPALAGGEDYELLVAVPARRLGRARAAAAAAGTPLTAVGRVVPGAGVRVLGAGGAERPLPPGHDHLRPLPRSAFQGARAPPPRRQSRRGPTPP